MVEAVQSGVRLAIIDDRVGILKWRWRRAKKSKSPCRGSGSLLDPLAPKFACQINGTRCKEQ
jgi:hypothetical protein